MIRKPFWIALALAMYPALIAGFFFGNVAPMLCWSAIVLVSTLSGERHGEP